MIKRVSLDNFYDAFKAYNRDNFSPLGLSALFSYLEDYEVDTGETIELDVIDLCCNYSEFDSIDQVKEEYKEIKDLDDLRNNTVAIDIPGTERLIIQNF